jgi:hypothetical protein
MNYSMFLALAAATVGPVDLRVLLLSGVWCAAYRRGFSKFENVQVPAYAIPDRKTQEMAA